MVGTKSRGTRGQMRKRVGNWYGVWYPTTLLEKDKQLHIAKENTAETMARQSTLVRWCLSAPLILVMIFSYGFLGQIILYRKLLVSQEYDTESSLMIDWNLSLLFDNSREITNGNNENADNDGDGGNSEMDTYDDDFVDEVLEENEIGDSDKKWWMPKKDYKNITMPEIDFDNRTQVVENAKTKLNELWPFEHSQDAKLYFIHVGKAGGKSLYKEIYLFPTIDAVQCRMQTSHNNPRCIQRPLKRAYGQKKHPVMPHVARRLLGHVHVHSPRYTEEEKEWLRNETNLLVFTVRDPVDRIVSAFNFHHNDFFKGQAPKPRKEYNRHNIGATVFIDCFKEVEDLARAVMINSPSKTTELCQSLAVVLLQGRARRKPCPHFYWNYRAYTDQVWTNRSKAVAVLRTENQWNDLARLETLLGGSPKRFLLKERKGIKFTHGSERFYQKSGVSAEGAVALCCVLKDDIQVYHDLILASVNLKYREKVQTLRNVLEHCGVDQELHSKEVLGWKWKEWYETSCKGVVREG